MTTRQPVTQEGLDQAVEKLDEAMNLLREVRQIAGVMRIAYFSNVHVQGCMEDIEKLSGAISEWELDEEDGNE